MNKYNLPTDIIEQNWAAKIIPDKVDGPAGGIFLGSQNDKEYFVDSITLQMPRPPLGTGLGIELAELAGGRDDGLGITVVSGLVEGGYVGSQLQSSFDLMPGDSIASISVARSVRGITGPGGNTRIGNLAEKDEVITAKTECLAYDATVDAIVNLPPPMNEEENIVFKVKRLRRKPIITVNVKYPPSENEEDAKLTLFAGENLRFGMLVRGLKVNDPLAKRFDTKNEGNCGAGGLCRTCSVSVVRGGDLLSPQKVAEKQMLEDNPRWRLACKAFVGYGMQEGDMTVHINPNQW